MHNQKSLKSFLFYHTIAALFFFSWYCSATNPFWTKLDIATFEFLNGSLKDSPISQIFWALANLRVSDLFGALFMTGFSLLWVFQTESDQIQLNQRPYRLAQFLYILIWFEIGILLLKEVIFPYLVQIDFLRDSPSIIFASSTIMLSEVIGWLKIKDSSHWCFPGDHAFIILQWALFMAAFAKRSIGITACISSLFFILPRLIAGAHWLSDALCGSLPLALLIVAWATCTPIYTFSITRLEKMSKMIFNLCNRTASYASKV